MAATEVASMSSGIALGEPSLLEAEAFDRFKEITLDPAESTEWQKTIVATIHSVVALHYTRPFIREDEDEAVGEATGFIVDAEKGIIMTNKHVIGTGPFTGYAVFDNHEECEFNALYCDPIHDFGFLKFDPADIKFLKLRALPLRPDLAKIGTEIRVVGNDAGEKLSILSGVISRLDRNAPELDTADEDFNIDYIQAACNASGGSSGSPVIDINGNVVGIESAGNMTAATDFFLPLSQPVRALRLLQQSMPISRGDFQVVWRRKPFEQCRHAELSSAAEQQVREAFPHANGLLAATRVIPEGPSHNLVEVGDFLIAINGNVVNSFLELETICDNSIGESLTLHLQRNGHDVTVSVTVCDLHALSPKRFLKINHQFFQELSYQMARLCNRPLKGVAFGIDYMDDMLLEVNGIPVEDIDTLIDIVKSLPDAYDVPCKTASMLTLSPPKIFLMNFASDFGIPMALYSATASSHKWNITEIEYGKVVAPSKAFCSTFPDTKSSNALFEKLSHSVVKIIPSSALSDHSNQVGWYGFVLDAEKGHVFSTVTPNKYSKYKLEFGASVQVDAKELFYHPKYKFHVLSYDPSLVSLPVDSLKFSSVPLKVGDELTFLGPRATEFNASATAVAEKVDDDGQERLNFTSQSNMRHFDIVIDSEGLVRAMGAPKTDVIWLRDTFEVLRTGEYRDARFLPIKLIPIDLHCASKLGVPQGKINNFLRLNFFFFSF